MNTGNGSVRVDDEAVGQDLQQELTQSEEHKQGIRGNLVDFVGGGWVHVLQELHGDEPSQNQPHEPLEVREDADQEEEVELDLVEDETKSGRTASCVR